MEVENNIQYKVKKLKVRADTTIEEVKKQLEFTEQFNEFSTTISGYAGFSDIFTQLNLVLFHQKELKKLNITLQYLDNITFENTIYKLKGLSQLTTLNLSFLRDIYFSKSQSQSFSACLSQFPMLTKLKLDNKAYFIDSEIELYEFYKSNIQLTSIHFVLSEVKEQSNILNSILRGIRFQKSLESFKLQMQSSSIRASILLDILGDELRDSSSIKKMKIDFGSRVLMTQHDFTKLGNILKIFIKLEKISFSVDSLSNSPQIKITGFEDDLLKLTHLTNLSFKNFYLTNWMNIVGNIAQLESLKNVKLQLTINSLTQINNDIISFGQSLNKIQKLEKLQICFSYNFKINIYQVIQFIIQLKSAENLKKLTIAVSSYEDSKEKNNYEDLQYQEFIDTINNLEKFSFSMNLAKEFHDQRLLDNILSSIKNAQKLQSILVRFFCCAPDKILKQSINLGGILNNKKSLKSIDLSFQRYCLIEESQLMHVFENLQQNLQLNQMSFQFNNEMNLSSTLMKQLSESLIQLQQLKDLKITFDDETQLNSDGIISFGDSLSNLKVLKNLILKFSKNSISVIALNHLMSSIRHLTKLQDLDLRINGDPFTSDEDEKSFGDSFEFSTILKKLEISLFIKKLKYKNISHLFQSLSNEKKIEEMFLDIRLALNHKECLEIYHYFSQLKSLRELYFQSYSFSLLALTGLFNSLPQLREILYDTEDKELPNSLWAQKKLKKKMISNYSLTEQKLITYEGQKEVNDLIYWTSLETKTEKLLNNETKENADIILPYLFQNLSLLNEFSLFIHQNQKIGVDLSCKLFRNLSLLHNLSCLKIEIGVNNQIGSESLNVLGTTLTKLKLLDNLMIDLSFSQNNIKLSESQSFYKDLSSLSQLEQLDVRYHFSSFDYDNYTIYVDSVEKLLESISKMKSLKNLKIIVPPLSLNKQIINGLSQICSLSLSKKLRSLYFYVNTTIQPTSEKLSLFRQCINQLNHLSELKTNVKLQSLLKQLRLVSFEQITYFL